MMEKVIKYQLECTLALKQSAVQVNCIKIIFTYLMFINVFLLAANRTSDYAVIKKNFNI